MPLKSWAALMLLAALLALAGCKRAPSDSELASPPSAPQAGEAPAPDAGTLDATWQGVLPCADCDGIQTRLRLVADEQGRRFELRETYLAEDGGDMFESQGDWTEETSPLGGRPTRVYRRDDGGASRFFSLQPDGALEMMDARGRPAADGLAYRLQRM